MRHMKVKIFKAEFGYNMEADINSWLETANVVVHWMLQSDGKRLTITICYTEGDSDDDKRL